MAKIQALTIVITALFGASLVQASDYLYIGDSHSAFSSQTTEFSKAFVPGTEKNGRLMAFYAAGGSSLITWNNGGRVVWGYTVYTGGTGKFNWKNVSRAPTLSALIANHNPKEIVINLGDNMFSEENFRRVTMAPMPSYHEDSIRKFLAAIPASMKCTWIGPTYHKAGSSYNKPNWVVDDFYDRLGKLFVLPGGQSRCAVIDTRKANLPTETGDGLHHSSANSKKLADFVLTEWAKNHP